VGDSMDAHQGEPEAAGLHERACELVRILEDEHSDTTTIRRAVQRVTRSCGMVSRFGVAKSCTNAPIGSSLVEWSD
jgi:hypothetical protein